MTLLPRQFPIPPPLVPALPPSCLATSFYQQVSPPFPLFLNTISLGAAVCDGVAKAGIFFESNGCQSHGAWNVRMSISSRSLSFIICHALLRPSLSSLPPSALFPLLRHLPHFPPSLASTPYYLPHPFLRAISEVVRRQVVLSNLIAVLSDHQSNQFSPNIGKISRCFFHVINRTVLILTYAGLLCYHLRLWCARVCVCVWVCVSVC